MGITVQQDPSALKAAVQFQINAEFQNVRLLECSAETPAGTLTHDSEMSIALKMETSVLHVGDGTARFGVKLLAEGIPKQDSENKAFVFRISCTHELVYRLNPKYVPKDEEITAFREGNALFQCWPYSRETIHNLAMRMDVFISPLPFLRVLPKAAKNRSETKAARKKKAR